MHLPKGTDMAVLVRGRNELRPLPSTWVQFIAVHGRVLNALIITSLSEVDAVRGRDKSVPTKWRMRVLETMYPP